MLLVKQKHAVKRYRSFGRLQSAVSRRAGDVLIVPVYISLKDTSAADLPEITNNFGV